MATSSVHLSTMSDVIARAIAKYPHHRARIEKAAMLILLDHVTQAAENEWTVISQSDPRVTYLVVNRTCGCADSKRHPERPCKHRWACHLLGIAQERQRVLDEREWMAREIESRRFAPLTGVELARLSAWKARYEAEAPTATIVYDDGSRYEFRCACRACQAAR